MTEEIVRATLIVLLERGHIVSWPNTREVTIIANSVESLIEKEDYDDGQPTWEQEWYDFGERYE